MTYRVLWLEPAANDLRREFDAYLDLTRVIRALRLIDAALSHSPLTSGESRVRDQRVMFEFPLGIEYRVDEENHVVYVGSLWRID